MISSKYNLIFILLLVVISLSNAQTAKEYEEEALKKFNDSNYTGAIDDLNKAIELDPEYAFAYFGLGWTYYNLGQYELFGENLVKAFSLKPNDFGFMNYINAGFECVNRMQFESAVTICSFAVKLFPASEVLHKDLGVAFLNLQQYDSAEAHFKSVTQFNSSYSDAWYYLGLVNFMKNNYKAAIQHFQKAEVWHPMHVDLLWRKGFAYIHLKQFDKALIEINRSVNGDNMSFIKGNDTLFMSYLGLAIIYLEMNNMEKSKEYFEKAVSLEPLLKTGMEGVNTLKAKGFIFNIDDKSRLAVLFDKMNQ
jgi:tetratricopeptide (TPR) repeat protein